MFFEGAVKKAEIIIDQQQLNLLTDFDDAFWATLVQQCNAHILSSISQPQCKAFLLSESSLFIWRDRLLILTCGTTRLVKSVSFFIKSVSSSNIKHLSFQRKNEYLPHHQQTSFADDVKYLNQFLTGNAYQLGCHDGHHSNIYQYDNDFDLKQEPAKYELQAYQISQEASKLLSCTDATKQKIRAFLNINELFPGFVIDDHIFEPCGYSLNAIKGDKYITIHVTPQPDYSYVSFESNFNLLTIVPVILNALNPNSFDVMSLGGDNFMDRTALETPKRFIPVSISQECLANGSQTHFAHYTQLQTSCPKALKQSA